MKKNYIITLLLLTNILSAQEISNEKVSDTYILTGDINGKYKITMYLTINKYNEASGKYYYHTIKKYIDIEGNATKNALILEEKMYNDKIDKYEITGEFIGVFDKKNITFKGDWLNPKTKNTMPFILKANSLHELLHKYEGRNGIGKIKELIINGDINVRDDYGYTALIESAEEGNTEAVEVLINANADINASDNIGYTSLIKSAEEGNTKVVELLIDSGADINTENDEGKTALMLAFNEEIAQALIDAGADTSAMTILEWAGAGMLDEVQKTLDTGVNIDVQIGEYKNTALMWASKNGHTELVRTLIDMGANINTANYWGDTALIWASKNGRTDVVRVLIKFRAELNAKGKLNKTALTQASYYGHTDIVKLLKKAGAK